jgi:cytohesin
MRAAAIGNVVQIESLLAHGTSPNAVNEADSQTPLMWAAKNGHPTAVQALLRHGADPNRMDKEQRSALMYAAEFGHEQTVRILLEHGADPNLFDRKSTNAYDLAKMNGHKVIEKLLIDAGVNRVNWVDWSVHISRRTMGGMLPFNPLDELARGRAAAARKVAAAEIRVEQPAAPPENFSTSLIEVDPSQIDQTEIQIIRHDFQEGRSHLITRKWRLLKTLYEELAARFGADRDQLAMYFIPLLAEGKVKIDAGDWTERIEVIQPTRLTAEQVCAYLDARIGDGATGSPGTDQTTHESGRDLPLSVDAAALMQTVMEGRSQATEELLRKGADVNARLSDGWTPLMCAAWNGYARTARILMEHHADLEAREMNGRTALIIAAWNGHLDTVQALVAGGADMEARDASQKTALMWASQHGSLPVVQSLLEKGARVEASTDSGATALSYALREGNTMVVELLQEAILRSSAT